MSEIWVVSPGGRSSTGGICRMVDYAATSWEASGRPMRIIDSGGMAPAPLMAARFAGALLRVAAGGLLGRVGLLQVHVASHGSVARKALFVLLGRVLGVPVVLHLHGADFEPFFGRLGRAGRWVVRAIFRSASTVVVLGEHARAHMIARVGVGRHLVTVLPNAVPDLGTGAWGPRAGAPSASCRLLFLGALTERKGVPELLEALASPTLAALDWQLDLVGNGDERSVQEKVGRLGLASRVRLHGWRPSETARAMLADADLLVLPSRHEGLPMAILEAMAAGVAVLATDVGDVREAVADGETGLLAPPCDPQALAGALRRLIASPELRERFGRAGRTRYEERFAIDAYVHRLAAIFAGAAGVAEAPGRRQAAQAGMQTP